MVVEWVDEAPRQLLTFVVDVVGDNLIYILIENLLEIIMNFASHYSTWSWQSASLVALRSSVVQRNSRQEIGQHPHPFLFCMCVCRLMLSVSIKYSILPQQLLLLAPAPSLFFSSAPVQVHGRPCQQTFRSEY